MELNEVEFAKKLAKLVTNIRDGEYPPESMVDTKNFERTIAKDLETDWQTALAFLGYLLHRDYARIIPTMGIVLNPANKELRRVLASGVLNE
jgi:hypothetical protein